MRRHGRAKGSAVTWCSDRHTRLSTWSTAMPALPR